jgi:acetyl esterase
VTVQGISVVVKSKDREGAVGRYSALLESHDLEEFEIEGTGLTVTVFRGLSILSGTEAALSRAESLIASAFVDSLATTKERLVDSGWTIVGSLGSPNSLLARDADGSVIEFVERPDGSSRSNRPFLRPESSTGEPMSSYKLDNPARELTEALAKAPPLSRVPLADARRAVEAAQSAPIPMPDIDESWVTVPTDFGDVRVRLVRPPGENGPLPVIVYLHGGGWVIGGSVTHDLLTRRLSVGANAVVAFVEYSLAPEAKYPVQIEQSYAIAQWIGKRGETDGFDPTRVAVAGDSAGGNMATVLAIIAKQRGDLQFVHQSLYYPMTDANAEATESLRLFRDGPYGSAEGLELFWRSYLADEGLRREITVSPLQATLADLEGLPPALVIVDQNDLLRDQGEAYADKLRDAGVLTTSVRFNGTIHDFMRLHALRDSESTRAAIALAAVALRRAFGAD